jgi:hypothetical protein
MYNSDIAAVCGAFVNVNDEYQRRLIACNFQRVPPALCLYRSAARVRAAKAITEALNRSPKPVAALLEV